jgi:hypothetical protein
VTLDASQPSVGEAKEEIARVQGTAEARQELYRVAMRATVRENGAEPEADTGLRPAYLRRTHFADCV